jgi:hypothetical protein
VNCLQLAQYPKNKNVYDNTQSSDHSNLGGFAAGCDQATWIIRKGHEQVSFDGIQMSCTQKRPGSKRNFNREGNT